jgi:FkbM family methyltransferase
MKISQTLEHIRRLANPVLFECYRWVQHKQKWMMVNHLNPFEIVIENLNYKKDGKVKFVQVGAYDGVFNDPINYAIKANKWKGLLVEPQPVPFKKLCCQYPGKNMLFENSAISEENGFVEMQLCGGESETNIVGRSWLSRRKIKVPAITFKSLIRKHDFGTDIDLLQIDAEGFDDKIIYQALDVCEPEVIHFEAFLSVNRTRNLYNFLYSKKYFVYHGISNPCDSIAMKATDEAWQRGLHHQREQFGQT